MNISNQIEKIGCRLVECRRNCEGINLNPQGGIIPRCLNLETDNRPSDKGSVIVGINPRTSPEKERKYYRDNGMTYNSATRYWKDTFKKYRYYNYLHNLLDNLGRDGPILWTELVKCENTPKRSGVPPMDTCRTCSSQFLRNEIKLIPVDWPLFGLGKEVYKALSYMFPCRIIIGVPHPTGSYGHFHNLKGDDGSYSEIKRRGVSILRQGKPRAIWLKK